MSIYIVYKYTSPSGKSYIGQTCDPVKRQWAHQQPDSGCIAFASAIKKYGWKNFSYTVLATNLSLDQANLLEEQFINEHNSLYPTGYNLKHGGTNRTLSEHTVQKIQETKRNRTYPPRTYKPCSDETRARISAAHMEKHPSPETRLKLSKSRVGNQNRKGKLDSKEARLKKSIAHTGLKESNETRLKKSLALKGRPKSEETKQKLSRAAKNRPLKKWFPLINKSEGIFSIM